MSDFNRSRGCGAPLLSPAARDCNQANSCTSTISTVLPVSCGCQTQSTQSDSFTEGCDCCKASMRDALRLLCSNQISDQLDFDGFAFITDDLIVGSQPVAMCPGRKDNLNKLCGTFRRFSPCNCDLIDVEGTAYGSFGALVDVDQATLCSLSALAFQVIDAGDECHGKKGDDKNCCCCCSANSNPTTPEGRYALVRDLLQCRLQGIDNDCGSCVCHCDCTDDCCCAEAVLTALSSLSLNKRATLVAGLLALCNVSVLGSIGNVLVLGNDEDYRFYFVCANKVEMLA